MTKITDRTLGGGGCHDTRYSPMWVLALVLMPDVGNAGDSKWIGLNGGSWFNPANWQGGVPNAETNSTKINSTIADHTQAVIFASETEANAGQKLTIDGMDSRLLVDRGGVLRFGSATFSNGGALTVGNGQVFGNIKLENGFLLFKPGAGNEVTFAGSISGDNASKDYCPESNKTLPCTGLNINSGKVILTGVSSYSGQTKVFEGATLALDNALALRHSMLNMETGSHLEFTSDNTVIAGVFDGNSTSSIATMPAAPEDGKLIYSGVIKGAGGMALTLENGYTQIFTGNNTYTGRTSIVSGILQLGNGGNSGSVAGDIAISSRAELHFNRADDYTFDKVISGPGEVRQVGTGTLTLTGINTYSGGTEVRSGILAGNTLSLQGNILNKSQVLFRQTSDGTYAGLMVGAGSLVKEGEGSLTLTGRNAYTGGTQVNAGTLVGDSISLQGKITNNAQVTFRQVTDGAYSGDISGTGRLVKEGAGILALGGTNTYSGGTLINSGQLLGNTRSLQGDIVNNAQLVFSQATAGTYAGVISGSGSLAKNGAGVLTLTGNNTYTGATHIDEGRLRIAGGGERVFAGSVTNQDEFAISQTSVRFASDFVNNGGYFADAGSSSQFTNLNVGNTGYLVGGDDANFIVTGDFNNASLNNRDWDTHASNLIFSTDANGNSRHNMQLVGRDKGTDQGGFLNNFAWGSLKLDNGNQLSLLSGGSRGGTPALYVGRLVLPGGVSQLANISSNYNIYFDPANPANKAWLNGLRFGSGSGQVAPWSYSPNLGEAAVDNASSAPLSDEEVEFAEVLDDVCKSPQGALSKECLVLQTLTTEEKKQAVAQLIPNQVKTQADLANQFRLNRLDMPLLRTAALRHGAVAPLSVSFNGLGMLPGGGGAAGDEALRDSPLSAYIQARFMFGGQDTTARNRGYDFDNRAITFGADYRFTDRLVAGAMFNYANTEAQYVQGDGSLRSNTYTGILYGSYELPLDIYMDLAASYGNQDFNFTRNYAFPGVAGQARSQPSGQQYGFTLNLGRDFVWQSWQLGPYTRFEYSTLRVDAYQEQATAGFAMSVDQQISYSFVSDLGLQISRTFSLPWGVLTPSLRAEWEHQYLNDNRLIQMNLVGSTPGTGQFAIQSGNPDRDYMNLGGSLVATLPNGGSGFVRYESRLGQSDLSQHVVELGVRFSF